MGITIGSEHLKHAATELEDRDIERTTTKVENSDLHVLVGFVHTVSQSGSRRLVDDTAHLQTSDLTSLLGSLTLRVGEVSRYGDDSLVDLLTEVVLSGLLHLLQDHSRDFLRCVRMCSTLDLHLWITVVVDHCVRHTLSLFAALLVGFTHETLDGVDSVLRVGDSLTLCRVTNLALTVLDEAHDRRCRTLAFRVCDHYRLIAFKHSHTAVGST